MTAVEIPIASEEQWLAERARDVTSTEVAALYGASPYVTEFELWHRKRLGTSVKAEPSERVTWGKRLEATIAAGIAEDTGWKVRPSRVYVRVPDLRLGASFDFFVEADDPARGSGVLEIKNVDKHVFSDQWEELSRGVYMAPAHIELQLQAQLDVRDYSWGAIAALVGGNEIHLLPRDRDRDVGDDLRRRVNAFWQSIAAEREPSADYSRDADFIAGELRRSARAGVVVVADRFVEPLVARYAEAHRARKAATEECEALKAEILHHVGAAARIDSTLGRITCGDVADSPGTIITPDMVGQRIGGRRGFRQFLFTPTKD